MSAKALLCLAVIMFISVTLLPMHAEQDGKISVKTRVVKLSKAGLISPVFEPAKIESSEIDLPGKNGEGFKIARTLKKILVDIEQNGQPSFVAFAGGKSKPFSLSLRYAMGAKVKQSFKIILIKGMPHLVRLSGMQTRINGQQITIVDDNSNGHYGEISYDAIYYPKCNFGCPLSKVALIGGSLFEIRVRDSGTQVEYEPYYGDTGRIDVVSEWGGVKPPQSVIVRGGASRKRNCLNVAGTGPSEVPAGRYSLYAAYLPDVVIDAFGAEHDFMVMRDETYVLKWGIGLKFEIDYSFIERTREITLNPPIKILGAGGEIYKGEYLNANNFKVLVQSVKEDGSPTGAGTFWKRDKVAVDPMHTEIMWVDHTVKMPADAVAVQLSVTVPGVGVAKSLIPIMKNR